MNSSFSGPPSGTNPGIHAGAHDFEARALVERELEAGEQLHPCSRANPEALARRARPMALFGALFLGFAIFWTLGALAMTMLVASAFSSGLPLLFPLWGLPFCGVGVWLVLSPSRARKQSQSTFYGVTDRRAVVIEGAPSRSVRGHRAHRARRWHRGRGFRSRNAARLQRLAPHRRCRLLRHPRCPPGRVPAAPDRSLRATSTSGLGIKPPVSPRHSERAQARRETAEEVGSR